MPRWNNINIYNDSNSRSIPFYVGYRLSNNFKVIGKSGRVLTEIDTTKSGYKFVNVMFNGKSNILYLHRAVALVHVKGYFNGAFVDHIDGNPFNYTPENLRRVTPSENIKYCKNTPERILKRTQDKIRKLENIIIKLKLYEEKLIKSIDNNG